MQPVRELVQPLRQVPPAVEHPPVSLPQESPAVRLRSLAPVPRMPGQRQRQKQEPAMQSREGQRSPAADEAAERCDEERQVARVMEPLRLWREEQEFEPKRQPDEPVARPLQRDAPAGPSLLQPQPVCVPRLPSGHRPASRRAKGQISVFRQTSSASRPLRGYRAINTRALSPLHLLRWSWSAFFSRLHQPLSERPEWTCSSLPVLLQDR